MHLTVADEYCLLLLIQGPTEVGSRRVKIILTIGHLFMFYLYAYLYPTASGQFVHIHMRQYHRSFYKVSNRDFSTQSFSRN